MKAILIIDMPDRCEECKFNICYNYVDREESTEDKVLIRTFHKCILTNIDGYDLEWSEHYEDGALETNPRYDIHSECPLKLLPQKIEGYIDYEYGDGWNDCIDKILESNK